VSYGYAQWRMGAKRRAENLFLSDFLPYRGGSSGGETEELENKKRRKGKEGARET
jgi:hypothetical protein